MVVGEETQNFCSGSLLGIHKLGYKGGGSISGIEKQVLRQASVWEAGGEGRCRWQLQSNKNVSQISVCKPISCQAGGMEWKMYGKSFLLFGVDLISKWPWFQLNQDKLPLWKSADCKSWLTAIQIAAQRGWYQLQDAAAFLCDHLGAGCTVLQQPHI